MPRVHYGLQTGNNRAVGWYNASVAKTFDPASLLLGQSSMYVNVSGTSAFLMNRSTGIRPYQGNLWVVDQLNNRYSTSKVLC